MPAIIVVNRHTGAATGSPAVGFTKTSLASSTNRMAWSDNPLDGTNNPIPIPTSGTNLSWWVSTRLAVTTTGPATSINNVKWYSDGVAYPTGLTVVGNTALASTGYTQATGVGGTGTNGTTLNTTNYTALTGAPVDINTFISSSPKAITASLSAGQINQDFGDFFVYQLQIISTALAGVMAAKTITLIYDEV